MIALIEMIFGSKVGRVIAEIVVIAALLGSGVLYLEHRGATSELQKLQKSSQKLLESTNAEIAKVNSAYRAEVQTNQEKTDAATAANTALQSELDERVRDFDAYRSAHPDVASPAGSGSATTGGECGSQSCADLAVQLAERGNQLARSASQLSIALQGCERDRDSLTGEPR